MAWLEHHRESERCAADAEVAYHRHERSRAQELYARAAEAEKHALHCLNPSKIRTYGISAVSVVSLYFKAARLGDAEDMAHSMLASGFLPGFASDQLRNLLHSIWSEKAREQAGVQYWIEILEGTERIKIDQVGEAVDDVIGPMVNRPVIVQIVRDPDGSCHFRDIEADE